jgi:hypothetical protein
MTTFDGIAFDPSRSVPRPPRSAAAAIDAVERSRSAEPVRTSERAALVDEEEMTTSGRRRVRTHTGRVAAALSVVALLVVLPGCGAARSEPRASGQAPLRSVGIDGVSVELPAGWDGYASRLGPDKTVAEIWAASRQFVESSPRPKFPQKTLAALAEDGIAVEIVAGVPPPGSASWPLLTRVSLADG